MTDETILEMDGQEQFVEILCELANHYRNEMGFSVDLQLLFDVQVRKHRHLHATTNSWAALWAVVEQMARDYILMADSDDASIDILVSGLEL